MRAPLLSTCWVPVEGPLPLLGTPTSGGVGPVQTTFESMKAVAGTGRRAEAQPPVRRSVSMSTTPGRGVACGSAASPLLLSSFRAFVAFRFYPQ